MYDIEQAIGVLEDLQRAWKPAFEQDKAAYPDSYLESEEGKKLTKKLREKFLAEELPKYLNYISSLLKKNDGKWLASKDQPTIADCYAVPVLRSFTRGHMYYVPESSLETNPDVIEYIKRFCALEPVKGRYNNGIY